MSMRIKVDSGKYTFIQSSGGRIDILRHDQPWIQNVDGANAIFSLMAELDAARLVLEEARKCVASHVEGLSPIAGLRNALDAHARLVSDTTPPSPWAKP
jgi:hypothetical protein